MIISELNLRNFRCFDDLSISFEPGLTVIVGDNGKGKTAVLDAIAIGISPFVGAFSQGKKQDISPDDVRLITNAAGQIDFNYPSRIEIQGVIDGHRESWARERKTLKGRATIGEAKSVISHAKDMQSFSTIHGFTKLPVVRYYGICRLCREIKAAIPKQNPRKYAERSAGYIDCLESASTFDVFQAWFLAATHAVFQYEQAQAQKQEWDEVRKQAGEHWKALRNTVVKTVNHVLKPTGWQNMEYDATLQKLVCFHQEQGRLGVDQLSSGIRTMIGLVADLAYRAVKLNPHLKEQAAAEAEGIVLIDEVDLHLHPAC